MNRMHAVFVHTDHPAHRQGGMTDCIGIYDDMDAGLRDANSRLTGIWSRPNQIEIAYVDVLDMSNGGVACYKRYRHERELFYTNTYFPKRITHDPTPY